MLEQRGLIEKEEYPKIKSGPCYMEYTVQSKAEDIADTAIHIAAGVAILAIAVAVLLLPFI